MGIGGWGLIGTFVLIIWISITNHIEERKRIEAQEKLDLSRVSTSNPVKNLAGCMANHSSYLAKMNVASIINDQDKARKIDSENIVTFENVRDSLLQECANEHYPKIKAAGYNSVAIADLNATYLAVMRDDPEVVILLRSEQEVDRIKKSIYVK